MRITFFMLAFWSVSLASAQEAPTAATDVTRAEIEAVRTAPVGGVDRQIKVVDIGQGTNVGVGILHRDALSSHRRRRPCESRRRRASFMTPPRIVEIVPGRPGQGDARSWRSTASDRRCAGARTTGF